MMHRKMDGSFMTVNRYGITLGSIPEAVPQIYTMTTNPDLIFAVLRDPPGPAEIPLPSSKRGP